MSHLYLQTGSLPQVFAEEEAIRVKSYFLRLLDEGILESHLTTLCLSFFTCPGIIKLTVLRLQDCS